jgi:crotonobetainyl-CoA hydratase
MDRQTHEELDAAIEGLSHDPAVRVAVITGEGRAFCAGQDLKYVLESGDMTLPANGFGGIGAKFDAALPLIAAVNGIAFGGGFELALGCDIIIASEKAVFGLPEPKIGVAAVTGGIQRLTRAIGTKRAMGICLTGRNVTAAEGLALGFVNEVVKPEDLIDAAIRWAKEIAATAPMSARCNKEVVQTCMDVPDFATMMALETYPTAQPMLDSADAKEGIKAFLERRAPLWQGR